MDSCIQQIHVFGTCNQQINVFGGSMHSADSCIRQIRAFGRSVHWADSCIRQIHAFGGFMHATALCIQRNHPFVWSMYSAGSCIWQIRAFYTFMYLASPCHQQIAFGRLRLADCWTKFGVRMLSITDSIILSSLLCITPYTLLSFTLRMHQKTNILMQIQTIQTASAYEIHLPWYLNVVFCTLCSVLWTLCFTICAVYFIYRIRHHLLFNPDSSVFCTVGWHLSANIDMFGAVPKIQGFGTIAFSLDCFTIRISLSESSALLQVSAFMWQKINIPRASTP